MVSYIALISNKDTENDLNVETRKIKIFDSCVVNGIEVFETPYDAICNLNEKSKLIDCTNISIYIANISDDNIIKISNGNDQIVISTCNVCFKKYNSLVLGGLIKYINGLM